MTAEQIDYDNVASYVWKTAGCYSQFQWLCDMPLPTSDFLTYLKPYEFVPVLLDLTAKNSVTYGCVYLHRAA